VIPTKESCILHLVKQFGSDEGEGFPVLIPSLAVQEEIVQVLRTVNTKLARHVRRQQLLSGLFCTLLHQLMPAQIRVHGLSQESLC